MGHRLPHGLQARGSFDSKLKIAVAYLLELLYQATPPPIEVHDYLNPMRKRTY